MKRAREMRIIAAFLVTAAFLSLIPGSAFAEEEIIPVFLQEVPAEGHALPEELAIDFMELAIEPVEEELADSVQKGDPAQAALKAAIEEELNQMEKTNRMETSFRTANLSGIRAEIVAGKCGEDSYFSLYSDGCLEIIGKGTVSDAAGWQGYEEKITSVKIEGPDVLEDDLFTACTNLRKVSLGTNVEKIGNNDFGSGIVVETEKELAEEFVTRCYHYALGREGDASGLNIWTEALLEETSTPQQVVNAFLFCPEAVNINRSNSEYISRLYQLCFDRDADREGLDYWSAALENGMTREEVAEAFSSSAEFSSLLETYGLK